MNIGNCYYLCRRFALIAGRLLFMMSTVVRRDGHIVGFFKKKSAGRVNGRLSASQFIAMQTEEPIIGDSDPNKVKDILEEIEKELEKFTSYQTETEQQKINKRKSRHYNYDEASATIQAPATGQAENHSGQSGCHHHAHHRFRRVGSGERRVPAHELLVQYRARVGRDGRTGLRHLCRRAKEAQQGAEGCTTGGTTGWGTFHHYGQPERG